jgi:uncharacterized protein (UPF0264 family)
MTGMLASVNSADEALIVLAENVDIIDLKNPAMGSLGALDSELVKNIVAEINGDCLISATIGDLPMQPDLIFNAVKEMADTGVNYVKIGFFPNGNPTRVIEKLNVLSEKTHLIAVLFADTNPDFNLIDNLKTEGFHGVMLDTLDKANGSLTGVMAKIEIEHFVSQAKSRGMVCGLAGSLVLEDIPKLLAHQPDYLGFRGALCDGHERVGRLNALSVRRIKQTIDEFSI